MHFSSNFKNSFFVFLICFLLFFSVRFPEESVASSTQGMKLWFNILIPTLLPFMILTGILIKSNLVHLIFRPFHKVWRFLFGLSPQGFYAFLMGLICGYPMGAKITSDLYEHHFISKREAHYLLTFANNASPAFIINYLYLTCLKKQFSLTHIFYIFIVSNLVCMLFFRFVVFRNRTIESIHIPNFLKHSFSDNVTSADYHQTLSRGDSSDNHSLKKETSTSSHFGTIIDVSIMNGFETITRLGGYILLFSLISAVINHYSFLPMNIQLILSSSIELTSGLHQIAASSLSDALKHITSISLTAFGGFSILAQTRSIVNNQLSLKPYVCSKFLNTVLCILLTTIHI